MNLTDEAIAALQALKQVLDRPALRYKTIAGAADVAAYLGSTASGDDEETLTEWILADFLETVLGFPADGYFPQLLHRSAPSGLRRPVQPA